MIQSTKQGILCRQLLLEIGRGAILICCVFLSLVGLAECFVIHNKNILPSLSLSLSNNIIQNPKTLLFANNYIRTNLQSLADERIQKEPIAYRNVRWLDPTTTTTTSSSSSQATDNNKSTMTIPIYPIPAVYLPHTATTDDATDDDDHHLHVLNNVEPRNIQMALDLNTSNPPLFCVTLVAADTGNIASIGTLLRVERLIPTYYSSNHQGDNDERDGSHHHQKFQRIQVHAKAIGIVEIDKIVQPVTIQDKILQSPKYLQGTVIHRQEEEQQEEDHSEAATTTKNNRDDLFAIQEQMNQDFNVLKSLYSNCSSSSNMGLVFSNLADAMPNRICNRTATTTTIWDSAQLWQSTCWTILHGYEQLLLGNRNEYMVQAASMNGGPLNLPIHLEDLHPTDRQYVETMQVQAQIDYIQTIRMDPCLDFVALLSMPNNNNNNNDMERWKWLASLIHRERIRMEEQVIVLARTEQSKRTSMDRIQERKEPEPQPRRGAWFQDELWE
eukprot:scaffold2571_cov104-Cylindrotheca_fusiformis.AAC.3